MNSNFTSRTCSSLCNVRLHGDRLTSATNKKTLKFPVSKIMAEKKNGWNLKNSPIWTGKSSTNPAVFRASPCEFSDNFLLTKKNIPAHWVLRILNPYWSNKVYPKKQVQTSTKDINDFTRKKTDKQNNLAILRVRDLFWDGYISDSFRRLRKQPPTKTTGIKRSRRLNHLADFPFRGHFSCKSSPLLTHLVGGIHPRSAGTRWFNKVTKLDPRSLEVTFSLSQKGHKLAESAGRCWPGFFFRCLFGWVASEKDRNPAISVGSAGSAIFRVLTPPPGLALKAGGAVDVFFAVRKRQNLDLDSLFPTRATKLHSQNRVKSGRLWRCQKQTKCQLPAFVDSKLCSHHWSLTAENSYLILIV